VTKIDRREGKRDDDEHRGDKNRGSYGKKYKHRSRRGRTVLGRGAADGLFVPPNNQGLLTPFYNEDNNGDHRARQGVSKTSDLDAYTKAGIVDLKDGYQVFAGQRDDGFYADIQSIFDLDLSFGAATGTLAKPFDSQGGFNLHTIVLNIPIEELNGAQLAGVYATTSRRRSNSSDRPSSYERFNNARGAYRQVGRQGNPLFVEALLPIGEKDAYNQRKPETDFALRQFAQTPELSGFGPGPLLPGLLESIYIPDLIKVDLTTGPARGIALSAIGKAQISAGECGMLLWTLDEDRLQPIFQFISGGKADIMYYGSPEKMTLVRASGPGGFGVRQDQEFHTGDGSVMKVSVSFGQSFDGGGYLKQGLITIDSPAGMRSVIPAAGIAGCRG
jgi:Domain of unknown function (DUF4331)